MRGASLLPRPSGRDLEGLGFLAQLGVAQGRESRGKRSRAAWPLGHFSAQDAKLRREPEELGRFTAGGRQRPGNFLDKHAAMFPSSVWLLSPMDQREGSIGPLCLPDRLAWLGGIPLRQLGGEGQHFLSPLQVFRVAGGGGAIKTSTHLCSPEKSGPAGGGGGRKEGQPWRGHFQPCASALPNKLGLPLSWSCQAMHILAMASGPLHLPFSPRNTLPS